MIPRASKLIALGIVFLSTGLFSSAAAQSVERTERWDPDYQPGRTAWGHPDLQGDWTNATLTPLERRPDTGPVYTWEQADRISGRQLARNQAGAQPSDPNRPPPEAGNIGAYNTVFFEQGDGVAIVNGEPRTSLITFPSDGRIPPLSAEGQKRKQEYDAFRSQFGEYDHPELRSSTTPRAALARWDLR